MAGGRSTGCGIEGGGRLQHSVAGWGGRNREEAGRVGCVPEEKQPASLGSQQRNECSPKKSMEFTGHDREPERRWWSLTLAMLPQTGFWRMGKKEIPSPGNRLNRKEDRGRGA